MKRLILLIALSIPYGLFAAGNNSQATDTTLVVKDMKITIMEDGDRKKVRLYELNEDDYYEEGELVYEGHYIDGQSYKRRKYFSNLQIPNPRWNQNSRRFTSHWMGFGMGFANFSDGNLNINDVDGISLKGGKSLEYNLNFISKSFPVYRNNLAVVTGMGLRWNRYRINDNAYVLEVDGVTSLYTPSENIHLKASKLNTTSLTIPLLLEWQTANKRNNVFISAGIVGVIKTMSSSKIVYRDESGKKRKDKVDGGMNLRPVTMDFLVQAGFNHIGVYTKYAPVKMFAKNKGPELHPVSIGLQFYF